MFRQFGQMVERTGQLIRHKFHWSARDEKGATIVYFALVLMVLLGFGGIALDGSNAYVQQRRMQLAADAAAMAGARSLALEAGLGQVDSEVNTFAAANGADSATWELANADKNVNVAVTHAVETHFARLFGVNTISVTAVSEAGYRTVALPPEITPLTVPCNCVEFAQKTLTPPRNNYCVDNAYQSDLHVTYAIWLRAVDPTYPNNGTNQPKWHYALQASTGSMLEESDGTAHITGTIKNSDNEGFTIDYHLTGRSTSMPAGSPKIPGYAYDPSEWYYYTGLTGELHGLPDGRYNGAVLSISGYGPSFQIGYGANMWDSAQFGGAAWYDITVVHQPTTGVALNLNQKGDINIRLSKCNDGLAASDPTNSDECPFAWMDWNGGGSSSQEILDYVSDPSSSGDWRVGDWVSAGESPFSTLAEGVGGMSVTVGSTFDEWLGKEMMIPLYDEALSTEDQYQICGFATVVLQDYQLDVNPKWLQVQFKPWVVPSGEVTDSTSDYGLRDVRLYQ
ncbi:MAG: TadE/TadG family type IV pilus assembly protein [Caldilineaceae bacterium]